MKVSYPYRVDSLKNSLKPSSTYGIYPIGKFNAWHGGMHVEKHIPIKTIADGRVIAYRIPEKDIIEDLGQGDNNPRYSNGFILMQHLYSHQDEESAECIEFTFYSLYHHLMSKEEYEKNDSNKKKIPDVLAKFVYKVSDNAYEYIKGLEVYRLGSNGNIDESNLVFLKKGTAVEVLKVSDEPITVNAGKYWKISCTDYEGTTHNDVYASKKSIKNGIVTYGGDKSPKKGIVVFDEAKTTGNQLKVLEKGEDIEIDFELTKTVPNGWYALKDGEYIRSSKVSKTKEIDTDNLVFNKVVKEDTPLKAGVTIGNTGLFGSAISPKYRAAHIEVFSFDDPSNFLKGGTAATKEKNKKFFKIATGASLQPNITKNTSILKNTPVKVLNINSNFCQIQVIKKTATLPKEYTTYHSYTTIPNEDGKNDVFMIYADEWSVAKISQLQIFSRWGEKVYEELDFPPNERGHGWDGVFKGERMSGGVFVYFAEIEFVDGVKKMFKGDVAIVK